MIKSKFPFFSLRNYNGHRTVTTLKKLIKDRKMSTKFSPRFGPNVSKLQLIKRIYICV